MSKKVIMSIAVSAVLILGSFAAPAEEYASYVSNAGMSGAIEISSGPMIFSASDIEEDSTGSEDTGSTTGSGSYTSYSTSGSSLADSSTLGPGSGTSSGTSILQPSSSASGIISSVPGALSDSSSYGPSTSYSSDQSSSAAGTAGSDYASSSTTSVDLGFTLVSPSHEYGDYLVAEGSVQLADGTWVSLGYDQYIYSGYYRLLREETDSTGTGWYVVAFHGTVIGNYHTADGSMVEELWLKKSDCTATSTLELNTTDTTRHNIIRTALSLLGSEYVYGEAGPDTFDCSGFVYYVMGQNGISMPRSSGDIIAYGTEVGITGLRPGDVVGKNGHVGIYVTDDWFIHSSDTHTGVLVDSVALYNSTSYAFTNYRNVVGD